MTSPRYRRGDWDVREAYNALAEPRGRAAAIARALDVLERDPLACAGAFPGDLIRRLMDLPPAVWHGQPALYDRYRDAVRAAALARRRAPEPVHRTFWRDLPARLDP